MKSAGKFMQYWGLIGVLLAAGIIFYVLFQVPRPGVADQGDFDRVMSASGLQLTAEDINDTSFDRFLNYTVTSYEISDASPGMLLARLKETSLSYLITLISLICQGCGQDTFKTGYLAVAYAIIYVFAMYLIMLFLNIENKIKLAIFIPIAILVLLDGNYLVWFNSLYGEPMMITTLLLYIAAWVYYIYHKNRLFVKIIFIYITAFLFLGSKPQVLSALPIILLMLAVLLVENKGRLKTYQVVLLSFLFCLLVVYPVNLNLIDQEISKDRQYNAVFYGILKDSNNPGQDLVDMGLNPDMAVEAGKHAFLDKEEYIRYVPHSQITREEFYNKMSNGKLIAFYLTHPARFIQGMKYTAGQAFITSTFLGKYQRKDRETPVSEFNRFTLWSSFREHYLPKNLWFLMSIYIIVLTVSLIKYMKNQGVHEIRARIRLLWGVMFIGLIQFPMPYVGNGAADTYKQLYLFNFVFDLILVVSVCWCLDKMIDFDSTAKTPNYVV
ncbi:MAG: hypothetical protein ACOX0F_10710 [Syntrophomonadaceae bacterium]